jgi:hypothetical protein
MVGLRQALRSKEPLDLLAMVSGLLEVTDQRRADPLGLDEQRLSLGNLVDSFVDTPYAETTAALMAICALVPDELMQQRISRVLENRRHPMPDWLARISGSQADPDVWFLTHVLGDGDDYLLGVTLPSGHSLSALVYVDHNLGTVVKDAFIVPEPVEDLALKVGTTMRDPDQSLTRIDRAAARSAIEAAIDTGSRMYPPLTSDTWPMCRPLVEWMLRQLPSGAPAPERRAWSAEETAAIATDFFGSRFGAGLDRTDERSLLDSLLWFGTDYSTGDPLQWSPVTVEMLLVDWFPRKVVAEPAYLAKLPDLVRAFIGYCHHRQGIRRSLTTETLAAVDRWAPEYERLIRSARPQGPAALLAQLFGADHPDEIDFDESIFGQSGFDEISFAEIVLDGLDHAVGGRTQLMNLDEEPLPDEPFDWFAIPDDARPLVQETLDLCDRCADDLLDVEHRTAMRRFLSRAAVADPAIFRRKASPARAAAAVAWVICRANNSAGTYASGLNVGDLLASFGVKGSISQRAEPLLRANGVDRRWLYEGMSLGTPDLLTSERRAEIIATRDRWIGD